MKMFEDPFPILGGNPRAVILDANLDLIAVGIGCGRHLDSAARGNGIQCVEDEV